MDLSDIQGLVFHPYRRLPYARYVLLRFLQDNPAVVRRWLADLVASRRIDSATPKDVGPRGRPGLRLNVAFSYTGLVALGLDEDALKTFPLTFVEGLGTKWTDGTPDHRSRILGDVQDSAPACWAWGYQGDGSIDQHGHVHTDSTVDGLLMVFATDQISVEAEVTYWIERAVTFGAIATGSATTLAGTFPDDRNDPEAPVREPFGFVDGISQPVLKGAMGQLRPTGKLTQPEIHELDDGEILLGHRDGNRQVSLSPTVRGSRDPNRLLSAAPDDSGRRDLGYNGTFLVFRQIAQDVDGFERVCEVASRDAGIPTDRFKALLVGRWQDGSPLIKCPIAHDPALKAPPAANDFSYRDDPHGERCPIGAHTRRANPRDSIGENATESWRVTNRHRILRRGRPYEDGREKGLHFICLNANIARQFEFIQQNWINEPTFGGLDGEDDPVVGPRQGHASHGQMTLPPPAEDRVRRRVLGLTRFVTVKGGAYFFLPSLTALRYLAQAPPVAARPTPWQPAPSTPGRADRVRFLLLSRFSILLAVLLLAAPLTLLGNTRLTAIARPMFLVSERWELLVVSALASLAAAVALITFRLVLLYAKARFDVQTPWPRALTWRRVLTWQAASLPIVGTVLWQSATDAAGGPLRPLWWEIARFGLAALGGYAVAFGVLFVAAAARERGVRPDNPEDTVLVPSSRPLAWLKGMPSAILQVARPVVRFIESRAAMWTPDRGVGYVDHATGRILPGHLAAMMLVVTIGMIYVAGRWWLRPPSPIVGFQLPPLAYLLFLLLAGGWAAASAAFFLDRFRFPLLTAIAAWLVVAAAIRGTDHEFQVSSQPLGDAPSVAAMIASADEHHQNRGGTNSTGRPIIVVAAGGGGVHQAAWTARVLTGLTELWGPAFSGNLRLVSAVSAGSVGTLHFLNQFAQDGPPRGSLQPIVEGAKASATGDIWWGLAYPDLARMLLPFPLKRFLPGWWDRGWALEQAWHRALGLDRDTPAPTMGEWQADVADGWRPAVAFNATIVETGERAVLATYGFSENATTKGVAAITSGRDLSVVTAVRLSAAFPYVTPFARPSNSTGSNMVHLADGGYWDNHGVVSVLEWLRAAAPVLRGRNILLIQIPPSRIAGSPSGDRAWVWQQIAPLVALESVRTNAQAARNTLEIDQFMEKHGSSITRVELPYGRPEVSLGWHLSRRERCSMETVWRSEYGVGQSKINEIARILGPPEPSAARLPEECNR